MTAIGDSLKAESSTRVDGLPNRWLKLRIDLGPECRRAQQAHLGIAVSQQI